MGMQTQIEKYTVLSGAGLSLHQCGHEDCAKGHRFGPAVRDHYLLHCIFRGEGRFEAAGRSYSLRAGQGFLIVPGQVTVYAASETSPWLYHWVGFSGGEAPSVLAACGLSAETPVLSLRDPERVRRRMEELEQRYDAGENVFALLAGLYGFFSQLADSAPAPGASGSRVLDAAVDHIRKSYSYPLTVEEVARRCGVDRSQLFRLFKTRLGLSPQQYILSLRLERARELLRDTSLSVTEAMYSCGFSELCHFSRSFRRAFGVPPSACRRQGGAPIRTADPAAQASAARRAEG